MSRLAGKVALVTGGNTGIGRAVVLAFADEGADVAVGWIVRQQEADSLAEAVRAMKNKRVQPTTEAGGRV